MPAKVELQLGASYVKCGGLGARAGSTDSGGRTWAAYKAAFGHATAILDVQVDLTPTDWTPPSAAVLAARYLIAGNQRSWLFRVSTGGNLVLSWSPDGTFGALVTATSSVAVGAAGGTRKAVRATLVANNGAGSYEVRFYTAATLAGAWAQIGSTVTGAASSIFAGSADLELGSGNGGASVFTDAQTLTGKIHGFAAYSGIKEFGGERLASPDFADLAPGTEEFADFDGVTWRVEGTSAVVRDWVDATGAPVYERAPVEISRGRSNEAARSEPSRCTLDLNNRSGDFSPRNPTGAYYGVVGRNTPARVSLPGSGTALLLHRAVHDFAFARDAAGLGVTGDLDVRVDLGLPSWDGLRAVFAAKHLGTNQHSWLFRLGLDGRLILVWSADGTNDLSVTSTQATPLPHHGRKAVRATLDVNDGAAGHAVRFYVADTLAGTWTQLGDPVVGAGTTSVFDSSAELRVCGYTAGWLGTAHAAVYGAELRNGIDGSVVASPDFTSATAGAAELADAQGNLWDLAGSAEFSDRDYRVSGEVADWPVAWDLSGRDVHVPVEMAGVTRRLGQGQSPLQSTLRRGLTSLAAAVAYWPCEDGDDSTSLASGLPGHPAMSVAGQPDYASFSGFKCSGPLPQLKLSGWTGSVPDYVDGGAFQCWFLLAVPPGGVAAETAVARLWAGNATAIIWQLQVDEFGAFRLLAFNSLLATVVNSGVIAFGVNGKLLRVSIGLQQAGTGVDWFLHTLEVGETNGLFVTGTLASATLGTCQRVDVAHERLMDDVAVGHVSVHREIVSLFDLSDELNAWLGETAGARVLRLCAEEGVPAEVLGGLNGTAELGYQLPKTLLDLLAEAADADGGILYEPRRFLGIAYRTRASMYSQGALAGAALELDYGANQVTVFKPTSDDRYTRNDVTATRVGGASSRQVLTSGRLSVAPPPKGVGRYDDAPSLSLAADSQAASQASWRVHLGTVDEERYPEVGVELARRLFAADPALSAAVLAADVGDLLTVANLPAWMPPDDVRQLVQGCKETIRNVTHRVTWHCAPASPWDVGIYEDPGSRYSSQGSALGAAATSTATSLTVRTPSGPVWGGGDTPYDVVVGGERMTVTAVSGASSPQVFTVTRSVDGVVKAHREGAGVALYRPVYYGL